MDEFGWGFGTPANSNVIVAFSVEVFIFLSNTVSADFLSVKTCSSRVKVTLEDVLPTRIPPISLSAPAGAGLISNGSSVTG